MISIYLMYDVFETVYLITKRIACSF